MLMNRIGRRKTVLLSLIVTSLALLVPWIGYNLPIMLVSFSLLGIGNTLMQVSLNPLLSNIVSGDKLASTLTLGQFVKAIASFLAPILAAKAAILFGDWKLLFPIFAIESMIAFAYLFFTKIEEQPLEGKTSSFSACFALLGNKIILLLFLGILVHVGIDVGVNLTAPKLLIANFGMEITEAGYAASVYFFFRTIGCLSGVFILAKFSAKKFFLISVCLMALAVIGLFICESVTLIYTCIALIGIGNSNIFPIIFSQALLNKPKQSNEISGLMIMGISGGAVFPILMGIASDTLNSQIGAVIILAVCVAYLLFLITKIKHS